MGNLRQRLHSLRYLYDRHCVKYFLHITSFDSYYSQHRYCFAQFTDENLDYEMSPGLLLIDRVIIRA